MISWSSANTNSCQVTGPGFSEVGGTSGSVNVSVDATTTFTVTCFGSGGIIAEDVLVTASEAIPTFVNGPGTEGTEKQGAPVSILVDYSVSPPGDCPGCRVQMVIGLHDEPLGCAFDGNPSNPTIGNAAFSPLAPSIPGRYPIRQYYDTQANCAAAMSGYSKAASRKIGFLTVTPSGAAWFSGIGDLAGGAVGSVVEGLSGDGNVVLGTSSSTTFDPAAALWLNGDLFELGLALPASANSAEQSIYGASTDGSVLAGFSSDGSRDVAYVWRDGELASPIGSSFSDNGCLETNANCVANAVSGDGGLIVGTSQLGASDARAFVYSGLSSEMFALGDLTGAGTDLARKSGLTGGN